MQARRAWRAVSADAAIYARQMRRFSRNARLLLLSTLLGAFSAGVFRVAYNLYVLELGFTAGDAGRLVTSASLAAGLAAIPAGLVALRVGAEAGDPGWRRAPRGRDGAAGDALRLRLPGGGRRPWRPGRRAVERRHRPAVRGQRRRRRPQLSLHRGGHRVPRHELCRERRGRMGAARAGGCDGLAGVVGVLCGAQRGGALRRAGVLSAAGAARARGPDRSIGVRRAARPAQRDRAPPRRARRHRHWGRPHDSVSQRLLHPAIGLERGPVWTARRRRSHDAAGRVGVRPDRVAAPGQGDGHRGGAIGFHSACCWRWACCRGPWEARSRFLPVARS